MTIGLKQQSTEKLNKMDSNELNHNDDLDIVMIKLELTISEKEAIENILNDEDVSVEKRDEDLVFWIGEDKKNQIKDWLKNNNY